MSVSAEARACPKGSLLRQRSPRFASFADDAERRRACARAFDRPRTAARHGGSEAQDAAVNNRRDAGASTIVARPQPLSRTLSRGRQIRPLGTRRYPTKTPESAGNRVFQEPIIIRVSGVRVPPPASCDVSRHRSHPSRHVINRVALRQEALGEEASETPQADELRFTRADPLRPHDAAVARRRARRKDAITQRHRCAAFVAPVRVA